MLVGAKVCDLTDDLLWFVCGNFDVFPYTRVFVLAMDPSSGYDSLLVRKTLGVCPSRALMTPLERISSEVS